MVFTEWYPPNGIKRTATPSSNCFVLINCVEGKGSVCIAALHTNGESESVKDHVEDASAVCARSNRLAGH